MAVIFAPPSTSAIVPSRPSDASLLPDRLTTTDPLNAAPSLETAAPMAIAIEVRSVTALTARVSDVIVVPETFAWALPSMAAEATATPTLALPPTEASPATVINWDFSDARTLTAPVLLTDPPLNSARTDPPIELWATAPAA